MGKLHVEVTKDCFSFGRCIDMAPDVFRWADDGSTVADPDATDDVERVRRAAEACPRFAIRVREELAVD